MPLVNLLNTNFQAHTTITRRLLTTAANTLLSGNGFQKVNSLIATTNATVSLSVTVLAGSSASLIFRQGGIPANSIIRICDINNPLNLQDNATLVAVADVGSACELYLQADQYLTI